LDGIDDIGLWVANRQGQLPKEAGEFYLLVSDDATQTLPSKVFDSAFSPLPLGNDAFLQFGDDEAFPVFGNFDPPTHGADGEGAGQPGEEITFTNGTNNHDVNDDGWVTSKDVLLLINQINAGIPPLSPACRAAATLPPLFLDVNADELISSLDVLLVINLLNESSNSHAEGEPFQQPGLSFVPRGLAELPVGSVSRIVTAVAADQPLRLIWRHSGNHLGRSAQQAATAVALSLLGQGRPVFDATERKIAEPLLDQLAESRNPEVGTSLIDSVFASEPLPTHLRDFTEPAGENELRPLFCDNASRS
jgi:hypothetical protein